MRSEYRAVFSGPSGGGSYGPPRSTLEEAVADRPERAAETHEFLSAIQTRRAEPWQAVPLDKILNEARPKK